MTLVLHQRAIDVIQEPQPPLGSVEHLFSSSPPGTTRLGVRWIRHHQHITRIERRIENRLFCNELPLSLVLGFLQPKAFLLFSRVTVLVSRLSNSEELWSNLCRVEFGINKAAFHLPDTSTSSKDLYRVYTERRRLLYANATREQSLKSFSQVLRVPVSDVMRTFPQYWNVQNKE